MTERSRPSEREGVQIPLNFRHVRGRQGPCRKGGALCSGDTDGGCPSWGSSIFCRAMGSSWRDKGEDEEGRWSRHEPADSTTEARAGTVTTNGLSQNGYGVSLLLLLLLLSSSLMS